MGLLNLEELKKQIKEGKEISLDEITNDFKNIIREVLQTSSEEELTSHLGYEKHEPSNNQNSRNGYNNKTLKSKYGQIDVSIPRDRDASFDPKLVKKRETILAGSEDLIISLYTKGMSVRDIQNHLDDLYGYELSTETISNITARVIEKANEWQSRPLEKIYPIIFMDATILKIRVDRVVKNIAAYIMLGITLEGKKEIMGASALKPVYSALNEEDAQLALTEFDDTWGEKYPNITVSWTTNWNELATFFKYPHSVRKLIYTTNPIESLDSTIKRKTKSKGSFPTTESAFKLLYLATQEMQNKWNRTSLRNWCEIYPQLSIFFSEILSKYTK